ncbi:mucoidy inhibitor A [Cordyceps militaris]|uniref:Mucoidy inhibitor A n=1 Tax=Cordyceps militaris TaxID=73501 RepID=A0A2H4SU04_CORMI|nr:mucoidy inhibitor A [Cordyceps militaris]
MESIHKIEYKLANVPTRAVILFPGRAQVFRDVKDIELKASLTSLPGINEVTITGLSPTLDEDSVKVQGAGSAVITDISVESLPNRDSFQDAYPDQDSSDDESDDDDDIEDPEPADLVAARLHLTALQDEARLIGDAIASVDKRQQILDAGSDAADTPTTAAAEQDKGARLAALLAAYRTERAALGLERQTAVQARRDVRGRLNEATARVRALYKAALKESKERRTARRRRRESERRARADRREERERVRKERVKFWPRYCYAVKITLEAMSAMTPMSSRRQSVASETDIVRPGGGGGGGDDAFPDPTACSLCVSYVTSAAQWTPSYDLQLSTTGATATLCFDAKVSNQTSETWRNCRVSLSTSDAALAGADSALPELTPWRIRLAGKSHHLARGDEDRITRSRVETQECRAFALAQRRRRAETKPREDMFGLDTPYIVQADLDCLDLDVHLEAEVDVNVDEDDSSAGPEAAVEFARRASPKAKKRQQSALARSAARPMAASAPPPGGGGGGFGSANAPYAEPPIIDFEGSLIEEAGMMTSYDLPGLKTLVPKSAPSKQRVARVTFSQVTLSHSVVAKYRPVAYLQARLPNHSKLTLLPGPAGLTLDGSFLGRTALSRCSPGDVCTLNLGVDPAIKISYAKPDVRRATTGLFSKESSEVFARAVVLHNTRAAVARMTVRDQVPVSEDESLRVDVVTPRGLVVDGPAVVAGAPGREEGDRDRDWGRAAAQLAKGGEVSWDVRLNAGKMVKLWLEYAVSAPSGDVAVEC